MRKKKTKRDSLLIHGVHSVTEALRAGKPVEKLMIARDRSVQHLKPLIRAAKQSDVLIQKLPTAMLDRISDEAQHQGIVAHLSPVPHIDITTWIPTLYERGKLPLLLLLDGVTDTGNLGAMIRTAECLSVDAIILPQKNTAPLNHHTIKASSGAVFHMPITRVSSPVATAKYLLDSGFQIIAAQEGCSTSYRSLDYRQPTVFVLGDEGVGVSKGLQHIATHSVSIPMFGKLQSLNVSVACGVLLAEVVRQRSLP